MGSYVVIIIFCDPLIYAVQGHLIAPVSVKELCKMQTKSNGILPQQDTKKCHWLLWGEFNGDRWIPRTKGQ